MSEWLRPYTISSPHMLDQKIMFVPAAATPKYYIMTTYSISLEIIFGK